MPEFRIRRTALTVEEIHHEGGPAPEVPQRRAACMTVIANPFAGRYVEDIAGFMEDLKLLGAQMAQDRRGIPRVGRDAGADRRGPHVDLEHQVRVLGEPLVVLPQGRGEPVELLPEGHGHGILQLSAPHLQDVVELLGLGQDILAGNPCLFGNLVNANGHK